MKTAKFLILLTSFLMIGCGIRKKNLSKTNEETRFENNTNLVQNTTSTNSASSFTDLRSFLSNSGLKIVSNGQRYEIKYGDFSFSGAADMELTEKKEETIFKNQYRIHTTYVTDTKYQTKTFYKTKKNTKNLNVERKGVSFGSLIGIIFCSLLAGGILWEVIKRFII